MPDAYENYMTFAHQMQKLNVAAPMTPRDLNHFTYDYDARVMSTESCSPSSMDSPIFDQMNICESLPATEVFDIIGDPISIDKQGLYGETEIKIIVQPANVFRFRYQTEMCGTHEILPGEKPKDSHKKVFPTVKLENCHVKDAVIRCTLVTADGDRRFPHGNRLVMKKNKSVGKKDENDSYDIKVSDDNDYTAIFCDMGIIQTKKEDIKKEIIRKLTSEILDNKKRMNINNSAITAQEDLEMEIEAKRAQKLMKPNIVSLCFQGFRYGENGVLHPLTEKIYSQPIKNLKCAATGELKICRIDKHTSSCDGGEEVWLLVKKVERKNIKVILYELDETENVVWEDEGKFTPALDVHYQYAIVFKTPPYKNTNITKPVEVFIKLERPSDGVISKSIRFLYKPSEKNLSRKRPRVAVASASLELASNVILAEQLPDNCVSEISMTLPADEISSVSQELAKLLNDDKNKFDSQDVNDFINTNKSQLETWLNIALTQDEQKDSDLVSDGALPNPMMKDQDFSAETLKKIYNIFKQMEINGKTESSMTDINNLLPETTTNFGDTPLHFALRMGHFETAKYIIACIATDSTFKSALNLRNIAGKTPLHLAVFQDQSDIVRALLKLGADPNIRDEDGATSLHTAVEADANSCVHELLQSSIKIDLEAYTESGWSALHLAVKVGSLYVVKALVDAGANVNSTDMSYGRTALHIAVDGNHLNIVEYLLTKTKIDANMRNFSGKTAMHTAVVKGGKYGEELVKILKNHGANPIVRSNNAIQEEEEEEEFEDEMPLMERSVVLQVNRRNNKFVSHEQFQLTKQDDEKVTDVHIECIGSILDNNRGWERLAQHTKNASLVRLLKKTSSPSLALFNKIRLQKPDLTVGELKNMLIEVQAFEAAMELDSK